MHTLIAGGCGFLGSHLAIKLLEKGYRVTIFDNFSTSSRSHSLILQQYPNACVYEYDVTTIQPADIMNNIGKFDYIYHLASPASPNHHSPVSYHALPMETMMVNTTGTRVLLELAALSKAKFLFASTSECYGDPAIHPQPETYNGNVSTTGPRSVYDEAKRFGETLTAYYWRSRNVDARIVRIFNTYGPGMAQADMRMIVNFIYQALTDRPITIFGDGTQTRSLCYVTDTIEGLVRLMEYPHTVGEVVNIGASEEHSVLEYAHLVKKLTNSHSQITYTESLPTHDPKIRQADITKAKRLLQWQPSVSLEEGLTHMIQWIHTITRG